MNDELTFVETLEKFVNTITTLAPAAALIAAVAGFVIVSYLWRSQTIAKSK